MTRNEVIKALRICAATNEFCFDCPLFAMVNDTSPTCYNRLNLLAADMLSETPLRCSGCTWYADGKCTMPHRDVDVKPDDYCSMGAWHSV